MADNNEYLIQPGKLNINELKMFITINIPYIELRLMQKMNMNASVNNIKLLLQNNNMQSVYGVNTGFGKLASTQIDLENLTKLQHNFNTISLHRCGRIA